MTYILIFITAIVSIAAFNNRQLFDRLAFVPYRVGANGTGPCRTVSCTAITCT